MNIIVQWDIPKPPPVKEVTITFTKQEIDDLFTFIGAVGGPTIDSPKLDTFGLSYDTLKGIRERTTDPLWYKLREKLK